MKRLYLIAVMMAVFCCAACAQDPAAPAADASLKAAGDAFCAGMLTGDADALFDFMLHPAMRLAAAKASGFETEQEFLDSARAMMQEGIKENPMHACTIDQATPAECPSYAIGHFESFGLTVQGCGRLVMSMQLAQDQDPQVQEFLAGQVDGAWYAVIEDVSTGVDYSETGENDMGLRDFATSFCAAMETRDPGAMEQFRISGIPLIAPSDHPDIFNWDIYMDRLTSSWAMNPEPVSCNVMSTQNIGACTPETRKVYASAGMDAVTCGILDLSVFMDKDMWYNGLSAVFLDGAWHIDPNDLVELSRIQQ